MTVHHMATRPIAPSRFKGSFWKRSGWSVIHAILFAVVVSPIAVADEKSDDAGVHVTFREVIPAASMINRKVMDQKGELLGTVSDIVIDLDFGCVAFFTIDRRQSKTPVFDTHFFPPSAVEEWNSDSGLRLHVARQELDRVANLIHVIPPSLVDPKRLSVLYELYQTKEYWPKDHPKDAALPLVTVDELDGRIVRDLHWQRFARIEEVLLTPDHGWRIAYLSLGEVSGKDSVKDRVAVPMAAFAKKAESPTWLMDIPADSAILQSTFAAGEWPQEIDRGWIEYIHVKYGSAVLGGVQRAPDENAKPAELK